jgi:hypothetical protein
VNVIADRPGQTVKNSQAGALKALILYEDMATGVRAQMSLDHLSRQLKRGNGLKTDLWRLEFLQEPLLREMAAVEAATMDIIVLSLHGHCGMPVTAADWMDRWLEHKGNRPYALAVLIDPEVASQGPDNEVFTFMRRIADLGDADLFCGAGRHNKPVLYQPLRGTPPSFANSWFAHLTLGINLLHKGKRRQLGH